MRRLVYHCFSCASLRQYRIRLKNWNTWISCIYFRSLRLAYTRLSSSHFLQVVWVRDILVANDLRSWLDRQRKILHTSRSTPTHRIWFRELQIPKQAYYAHDILIKFGIKLSIHGGSRIYIAIAQARYLKSAWNELDTSSSPFPNSPYFSFLLLSFSAFSSQPQFSCFKDRISSGRVAAHMQHSHANIQLAQY